MLSCWLSAADSWAWKGLLTMMRTGLSRQIDNGTRVRLWDNIWAISCPLERSVAINSSSLSNVFHLIASCSKIRHLDHRVGIPFQTFCSLTKVYYFHLKTKLPLSMHSSNLQHSFESRLSLVEQVSQHQQLCLEKSCKFFPSKCCTLLPLGTTSSFW